MLQIYIARHGQNEDNEEGILNGHRDRPLTLLGIEQAEELSRKIEKNGLMFDAVYSSPLIRAYATAETITDILSLPKPVVMKDLIERNFGVMTGKMISEVETLCSPNILKTETITYMLSPERGDTFPDLLIRGHRVIADVKAKHMDGSVLLVAHGDIGKMIYAAYYGLPWMDVLTKFHFGNSELLLLSEDSSADDAHLIHIKQYNH